MTTNALHDILTELIDTVENGRRGFAEGAEKLAKDGQDQLAEAFDSLSRQRASFAAELRSLSPDLTFDTEKGGTVPGALHRGWLALKDALSGNDPHGVLDAAEQGEDHAISDFSKALEQQLPEPARSVIERQYGEIRQAHDRVKALRDQAA